MKTKKHYILGIESSCDDTCAAVISDSVVLSNVVASQSIHELYGGVVPELASREHQKLILPVVKKVLEEAKINKDDLSAIAFTNGPGLIGSLMVGTSFAKSMSLALNIPLISVNHMQAHILAHFIKDSDNDNPEFPFLALTISGGHTQIVQVNSYFDMKVLGETLDDAAGEAFDKSGKVIGLKYPAGPQIDILSKTGDPNKFNFTKPKVNALNFSFSGLKTNFLNFINKQTRLDESFIKSNLNDICASLQKVIVEILMDKLIKASRETEIKTIVICGGVSANSEVRTKLKTNGEKYKWNIHIPKISYTTDNAAMIAITGQLKYESELFSDLDVSANARLKI
ncbi:tRNA (adenosine(37)-N6)-threonylcarbamoyltransferase complex transferase subunit TsaD [Flavobacteriaceae bacterium]|jgi:N6-L-threonylcarbamoyladenine synthase|nr:tRNA (adenosine(37)-N6)-threonylcarbamoyltransferase complex transferase subunit TsaD [Flavobacteriaceae bacterium]